MDMNRRDFLKRTAGAAALAGLTPGLLPAAGDESAGTRRPNVVLIISDDQGFTDYGFMGHDVIRTPRLDRLASESVVFKRAYVTTALCCPSLCSMLTGLYPHQHRITGNDPVDRRQRDLWFQAFGRCPQLPALLGKAGYASFQSGKFWLGHYSRAGFTDGMTVEGRHGGAGLKIGRETMRPVFDFIDKSKTARKPFFLWYAPFMPHSPHTPPDRILQKYRQAGKDAKYYAMCEWFDETCGQLLDHLDRQGLRDDTVVVYVCDNGWPSSAKGSPSEMGIRTPIMIRWPGHIASRMDEKNLASNIDIAPTVLTACGVKPPREMPGINLLDGGAVSGRRAIFGENFTHDMVNVDRPADSLRARSYIGREWKLTVWQNPTPPFKGKKKRPKEPEKRRTYVELYDLANDPFEKTNLAQKHPDKVAELLKRLNEWWDPGVGGGATP